MQAIQCMNSVSQPIIAATNQLVIYPPFLGGYLLSNFIQPVYRLSKVPVSDETPFAGGSPAITASQACRQLSQLCRLFASDLQLRLLRRNLSLVTSDRQLRGFRAGFGCHSPDDSLLLRWGAGAPPIPSGFAFVPIQGIGGRWTFFHLIFRGRISPLHSDLGFRLIGNDSLLLLLVLLCLGDNHTPSHLSSLPQIRPDAHFAKGGDPPPPHKILGYQSIFV